MGNAKTVCAVVVAYNRKALLLECLDGLLGQTRPVDAVYIIDNASTDGTPELLAEKGYLNKGAVPVNGSFESECEKGKAKIHYFRSAVNTGGAGGFCEGVKRSHGKKYDWLWLMDDDASPEKGALEKLLSHDGPQVAVLCPLIVHATNKIPEFYHHKRISTFFTQSLVAPDEIKKGGALKINANAFVGPLIKAAMVDIVGFPEGRYFIYGDDVEYIYRLSRKGEVLLVTDAVIFHRDELLNDDTKYLVTWKKFYGLRNNLAFAKKNGSVSGVLFFTYHYFRTLMKAVFITLFFKKNIKEAATILKYSFYSMYEGLSGNYDRYFPIEKIYVSDNR